LQRMTAYTHEGTVAKQAAEMLAKLDAPEAAR
jgi:hypothetical protein